MMLNKLFLFVLPYLFSGTQYNSFNKIYYTAGLISLFSGLGFNFSIKSVRLKNHLIISTVLLNSVFTAVIIWLFIEKEAFPVFPLLYAFCSVLISIFQFEFLFNGEIKKYLKAVIILFTAELISLAIFIFTGIDLFITLTLFTLLSLVIMLSFIPRGELTGKGEIINFYTAGLSAFVINSSASAVLLLGKYTAVLNFPESIANSFIFASILVTPIHYFGNIIERIIYSLRFSILKKTGMLVVLLFIIYLIYSILLFSIIQYYPDFLPDTVDPDSLNTILLFMLIGTALFGGLHFPLNGILFKEMPVKLHKKLASYQILILLVFGSIIFFIIFTNTTTVSVLLSLIYFFLISLAGVKYLTIFKWKEFV